MRHRCSEIAHFDRGIIQMIDDETILLIELTYCELMTKDLFLSFVIALFLIGRTLPIAISPRGCSSAPRATEQGLDRGRGGSDRSVLNEILMALTCTFDFAFAKVPPKEHSEVTARL